MKETLGKEKGKKALHVLVWIAEIRLGWSSPALPVAYSSSLCTWSPLSLSLFLESIVVRYTQYGLNGSKIFLIKDGLVTGTLQDSPLGKALCTKLYQNFPCVVAPIYFSDKRNSLIFVGKGKNSQNTHLSCSLILFFKVGGQLLLNKEWGDSLKN